MFSQQFDSFPIYTCFVLIAFAAGALLVPLCRVRPFRERYVHSVLLVLLVSAAALCGARLMYVLFAVEDFLYGYGLPAVVDLSVGGCMLYGSIFGGMLCAALLAKLHHASVGDTLDTLVVPALAAIGICRLAELFTTEGIGPMIENEALCFFPLAVRNEYGEWYAALFLLEALAAVVILLICNRNVERESGEKTLTALLLFSCAQIVLEDLRCDGFLRVGFVRVTEVIAALTILAVVIIRAREQGMASLIGKTLAVLVCVAGVGVIEWAQDKTNIPNGVLYGVMAALCVVMALIGRRGKERE